jgi:hypothetical protein
VQNTRIQQTLISGISFLHPAKSKQFAQGLVLHFKETRRAFPIKWKRLMESLGYCQKDFAAKRVSFPNPDFLYIWFIELKRPEMQIGKSRQFR